MRLPSGFALLMSFILLSLPALGSSDEIRAYRARIKFKKITAETTSGQPFGVIVGADVPAKGQIEFVDWYGRPVARPFPVKLQVIGVGANLGTLWSFEDNEQMSLYGWSGRSVKDLVGRYFGLRSSLGIYRAYQFSTWYKDGVFVVDGSIPRGVRLDLLSGVQLMITIDGEAEVKLRSSLPGDWNSPVAFSWW